MIKRETDTDLFSSVIHHIIGQQISTKAQAAISSRCGIQSGYSLTGLYLWAVAGGAIPEMKDYKPKTTKKEKH